MTLLLIVVLVAIGISLYQSGDKAQKRKTYKEKTKTNIELQKKLFCQFYKSTIEEICCLDLHRSQECETNDDQLFTIVESLFNGADAIPDFRSEHMKNLDRSEYAKLVHFYRFIDHITDKQFENDSRYYKEISYIERIFLKKHVPKDISKIFFGTPNTSVPAPKEMREELGIPVDLDDDRWAGSRYIWNLDYNSLGELKYLFSTPLSSLIYQICRLRTTKELKKQGYCYSYNNEDSEWQKTETDLKKYKEFKDKFPWYFD